MQMYYEKGITTKEITAWLCIPSSGYLSLAKTVFDSSVHIKSRDAFRQCLCRKFSWYSESKCIDRHHIAIIEEARQLINEYICFYNYERIQLIKTTR